MPSSLPAFSPSPFRAGIDALLDRHRGWLSGRVALLSHAAALDRCGASSAARLREELGSRLVALFGPEHGFFGQAGAGVATASRRHPDWGIPVYSLYGANRRPTAAMLRGVDTLVCDLQDLGTRCYTYLATLLYVLEAAAERGVRVVVADRPTPLPRVVDGPVAEERFFGFVAPLPVPLCTGLTPGEAARWIARDRGLDGVDLRVATMQGWLREGRRSADWPEWLPPSPGIRTWESAGCYPALVFCEALPAIDCGRGTNLAFRLLGVPPLRSARLIEALSAARLPGVRFHPHRYVAGVAPHAGREVDGLRVSVADPARFLPALTCATVLEILQRLIGPRRLWRHAGARPEWFDGLMGTDRVRLALQRGATAREIAASWQPALRTYRAQRREALLYPE
jgi:uncharacterized protein YbbC (DUF1343 family)